MVDLNRDEDDAIVEECSVCSGDIFIDQDCEEDDIVYCNDCEAEYLVRSLEPLRLTLLDDDINPDGDDEDSDFDEDYD